MRSTRRFCWRSCERSVPGYLWPVDPQDGLDATAGIRDIWIRGSRLVLRALRPDEIDEEWRAMVTADPMAIAELPDEASFQGPAPAIRSPGRWLARSRHRPGRGVYRAHPDIRAARPPALLGDLRGGDRPAGKRPRPALRARSAHASDGVAFRACRG